MRSCLRSPPVTFSSSESKSPEEKETDERRGQERLRTVDRQNWQEAPE